MKQVEALETLALIASEQWGLVTTAQGTSNGVSRLHIQRLEAAGILTRMRFGVYALPSARPGHFLDTCAAWLSVSTTLAESQPAPVVSGLTAATIYQLGDLVSPYYELTLSTLRRTRQPDLRFVIRDVPADEITDRFGLPVLTVPALLKQLGDDALDADHFRSILIDALNLPEVSPEPILKALEATASNYGAASGAGLLEQWRIPLREIWKTRVGSLDELITGRDRYVTH